MEFIPENTFYDSLNCRYNPIRPYNYLNFVYSLLHLASRGRSSTGVDHKLVIESTGLIQNNIYNVDNKETADLERQGTNAVTMMMSKKFQTFIRCSVKLLISSANKHKCFLEANSSLLQEILVQLISNIEEELSYYEGNLFIIES